MTTARQIAIADIPPFDADNIVFSGSVQVSSQAGYYWHGTASGTVTNSQPIVVNAFHATSFAVNSGSGITGNTQVYTNLGGAGQVGPFNNFDSTLFVNSTTGNPKGGGLYYQAANINARATVNDNGDAGTAGGALNGMCVYSTLGTGATFWRANIGIETDIAIETGASANFVVGNSVVLLSTNATAAATENLGFMVGAQSGGTATLDCAYAIGGYQGFNPIASTGGILKYLGHAGASSGPTITYGLDVSNCTFTGPAFKTAGFQIDGSGVPTLPSFTVSTLPTASPAARTIYVSNGTSNKRFAISDGTNWRWPDGAIVS